MKLILIYHFLNLFSNLIRKLLWRSPSINEFTLQTQKHPLSIKASIYSIHAMFFRLNEVLKLQKHLFSFKNSSVHSTCLNFIHILTHINLYSWPIVILIWCNKCYREREWERVENWGRFGKNLMMTFLQSRKESMMNCLLMKNMSFIYTRDGSITLDWTS